MVVELEKELKYFAGKKEEFLKHYEGQFVLIKDNTFGGAFTTEEEAYQAGIEKFGNAPMLIKRVEKEETIDRIPALTLGLLYAHI